MYESSPNGGMGIYWNLHISVEEIYKLEFLHMDYVSLSYIFSFAVNVVHIILFICT